MSGATSIHEGLDVLAGRVLPAGGVFELSLLKSTKHVVRGYFDAPGVAVQALKALPSTLAPEGVYITLNPLTPDLLARAVNRFESFAKTRAADADALRRLWLPLDIDPVRPAGISATDAELAEAEARTVAAVAWLQTAHGWPAPIRASGGNSGHALFAIDEANDAATADVMTRVLAVLSARFSDAHAKVDPTVGNAARIWTLYGTWKRKGDNTSTRPHRRSWIANRPDPLVLVTRAQLEAVAALHQPKTNVRRSNGRVTGYQQTNTSPVLDMRAEFEQRGWYGRELTHGKHAVTCPWASEHSGESGPTETVLFEPRESGGVWGFKCQHAHCSARTIKDVWELVRPPDHSRITRMTAPVVDRPPVEPLQADLAGLLAAVVTFLQRFVVMADEAATALALWVVHTYVFDVSDCTPYVLVKSATKRAGKTRLFEVLECLVRLAWFTGHVSAAALLRKIDHDQPTLLLDESDAAFAFESDYTEAVRGLLNSGYRQGGRFSLCVGQGAHVTVRDFRTFCPKAFAGIGDVLPDTVVDRSIVIELRRRAAGETVERFRLRTSPAAAAPIRAALAEWATTAAPTLAHAEPTLPDALNDRAMDVWEPLFAIADLAKQGWPEKVKAAAVSLAGQQPDDQDLRTELLKDIQVVLNDLPEGTDAVKTDLVLAQLTAMTDRPWPTVSKGDKPLNAHHLARLLKPFKIFSAGRLRFPDGERHRGYRTDAFDDAFARYLTPEVSVPAFSTSEVSQCPNANETGPELAKTKCPKDPARDTSKMQVSSMNPGLRDTGTLRNPEIGPRAETAAHGDAHPANLWAGRPCPDCGKTFVDLLGRGCCSICYYLKKGEAHGKPH